MYRLNFGLSFHLGLDIPLSNYFLIIDDVSFGMIACWLFEAAVGTFPLNDDSGGQAQFASFGQLS